MTILLFTSRDVIAKDMSTRLSPMYNLLPIDSLSRLRMEVQGEDIVAIYIDMDHTDAKNALQDLHSDHIPEIIPVTIIFKRSQLTDLLADPDFGWAMGIVWYIHEASTKNKECTAILSKAIAEWKKRTDQNHTDSTN